MNNNQPNYYGHHISSINMSFIELDVNSLIQLTIILTRVLGTGHGTSIDVRIDGTPSF